MGIFSTSRQMSADEKLQALIESKSGQTSSLKGLKEKVVTEAQEAQKQEELNTIDKKNEAVAATEAKLNQMKQAKLVSESNLAKTGAEYKLVEEGYELLMKRVLFEMTYNACLIDSNVKLKPEVIQESYVEFCHMTNLLETACPDSIVAESARSKFMQGVSDVVLEAATKAAKRIIKKAKDENEQTISFDLTDEEQDELDEKLNDLGKDEIEDMVKQKVLSVVNDEKEAGEKKAEFFKEIEVETKGDDDNGEEEPDEGEAPEQNDDDSKTDKTDDATKDDADDQKTGDEPDDEVKEGLDQVGSVADTNPDGMNSADAAVKESVDVKLARLVNGKQRRELNNSTGGSVFEALMIANVKRAKDEIAMEGASVESDDMHHAVLVESILDYTVLETLNTLGIYQLSGTDVTSMKSKLMNTVRGIDDVDVACETQKAIRINTRKLKLNHDNKVMSSNGAQVKIGEAL